MKNILLILPVFILGFVACSDDDVDTTKPTIELIKPSDETAFHPGDKIEFVCDFADNDELASYKVDIHSNFDDHEHTTSMQMKSETEDEHGHAWTYENKWTFEEGLSTIQVNHQEIEIPLTVPHDDAEEEIAEGHYHLGVYCLDVAGNENVVFIEIEIEHDEH